MSQLLHHVLIHPVAGVLWAVGDLSNSLANWLHELPFESDEVVALRQEVLHLQERLRSAAERAHRDDPSEG